MYLIPSLKIATEYEYQLKSAFHKLQQPSRLEKLELMRGSTFGYSDPNFEHPDFNAYSIVGVMVIPLLKIIALRCDFFRRMVEA